MRTWGKLSALAVVLTCTVLAIAWPDPEPQPWRPSAAVSARIEAAEEARPTVALFVGDSYTAGGGEVGGPGTFDNLACDRLGWTCYQDAQGGSGYTADGTVNDPTFTPYLGRLRISATSYRPDVVVVSGGRNDVGARGERAAAGEYLKAVRKAFPGARLVVLSPFWNDATPPAVVVDVREAVHAAAAQQGAVWVDTTGWLTPQLMGGDDVHPTAEGHRVIATRLTTTLQALS